MTDEPRTPDRRRELESAAVVLGLARPMVDDGACLTADQLRWIARRLVESLAEVLRIAASQCGPTPEPGGGDGRHAPTRSNTRP
ncbi:hypothetical protein OG250_21120 [Streptomyces sp. NBC_00487]|uniref:hypothetical protein n=1 Tax=unclassified Streptomyces TaxID=2593676 RepID=UPI002E17FA8D|nr:MULTISPECIES: hypothetical protein [unclassified Streptomyces]